MSAPSDDFQDSAAQGSERGARTDTVQDDYVSRPGQKDGPIPVQSDTADVEEGDYIDSAQADSDAQLQKDESDAIDQSNIIEERTRGASKPSGTYQEPGDEEGLGGNDGRSRVAGGPN